MEDFKERRGEERKGKVMLVGVTALFLSALGSAYGVYRTVFCHPQRKRRDVHRIPDSNLYRAHREKMTECIENMEKTPYEEVSIISEDGLRLYGKLYPGKKDAPLVISFHGYHGTYAGDGFGFFKICQSNGFSILMVDERAHGKSEGRAITFGIRERYDCRLWAEYAAKRFGEDADIFLAGVSMGAASVMMSCELGLPGNVKGIIADCGYTAPAAIIKETVRAMKLPVKPLYQLIRIAAGIFGHFDIEEAAALTAVERTDIPMLFFHGKQDHVVPVSMGKALYEACKAPEELVLIEGADHANSALTDYAAYENAVLRFIKRHVT